MQPDDSLRRAEELLRHRVDAYADRLSGEMLLVLTRLLILRGYVGRREARPVVDAALTAFAIACRTAAFDRTAPGTEPEPEVLGVVAQTAHADIRAAIEALDALERVVHSHAEGQEWVDALNNAREYRRAARWVRHARDQLASCLSEAGG